MSASGMPTVVYCQREHRNRGCCLPCQPRCHESIFSTLHKCNEAVSRASATNKTAICRRVGPPQDTNWRKICLLPSEADNLTNSWEFTVNPLLSRNQYSQTPMLGLSKISFVTNCKAQAADKAQPCAARRARCISGNFACLG